MAKLLLVEDDKSLAESTSEWLKSERYSLDCVHDGKSAIEMMQAFEYDLIILDWELPGYTGIEILKKYRTQGGSSPVIMLTGKSQLLDKEIGLDSGADDYLTKPFHPRELSARLRALLRRPTGISQGSITVDYVTIDTVNHKVISDGVEIPLRPLEFNLLEFLMKHPKEVFTVDALVNRVWPDTEVSHDSVYTCIRRVRKKVDVAGKPSVIRTIHSIGYGLGIG